MDFNISICSSFVFKYKLKLLVLIVSNCEQFFINQGDEIKTIVALLIFAIELLAGLTAAFLIGANFYCSGHSSLPNYFNYVYCKIITLQG